MNLLGYATFPWIKMTLQSKMVLSLLNPLLNMVVDLKSTMKDICWLIKIVLSSNLSSYLYSIPMKASKQCVVF